MAGKILFKKYANRRIYDTSNSTYVTLNHVADMIRQGQPVQIVDAKTNEDVTAFILTQIVLEEARKKNILVPTPLLHLIIQYGDNILLEFFEKYLQQTIQNYLNHKAAVDEQFKKWLEMGMDFSNMAQTTMAGLSPFRSFFEQFYPPSDKDKKD